MDNIYQAYELAKQNFEKLGSEIEKLEDERVKALSALGTKILDTFPPIGDYQFSNIISYDKSDQNEKLSIEFTQDGIGQKDARKFDLTTTMIIEDTITLDPETLENCQRLKTISPVLYAFITNPTNLVTLRQDLDSNDIVKISLEKVTINVPTGEEKNFKINDYTTEFSDKSSITLEKPLSGRTVPWRLKRIKRPEFLQPPQDGSETKGGGAMESKIIMSLHYCVALYCVELHCVALHRPLILYSIKDGCAG